MSLPRNWISTLLGLALLLAACRADDDAGVIAAPPVTVTPVTVMDVVDRIEATGELIARDQAKIAAEVAGRITEILADEGSAVEAGDTVLEIDPERRELELDKVRARMLETQAELREKERDAERVRKLHKRQVASRAQMDQAATDLELARARLKAAQAQLGVEERALRDASVSAPFAGLIAQRLISVGEFVSTGQLLFELVALNPIDVEFHLPEIDSSRVEVGQLVEVRVAPYPEEVFHARVGVVSPTIDPRTRTLRVKAALENCDSRLRPGLFARVDLGVSRRSGVRMIPEEAILRRADGAVVFRLVEDNRVERKIIETGRHRDGKVEVLDGLADDSQVVVRGHTRLVDGALVAVRDVDGTPVVSSPPARETKSP